MAEKLYRVVVETGYVQGGPSFECHKQEVLYCGYDRAEAEVAYYRSTPEDDYTGPGSAYRKTRFQSRRRFGE